MGDDGESEVLIGLGWVVEGGGDWLVVEEGALRWRYCNASRVGLGWVVEGRGEGGGNLKDLVYETGMLDSFM